MKKTTIDTQQNPLPGQIESFYKSNIIDLKLIQEVKFRHFRFRLLDGYFYKVKRKIRDSSDLQKCLAEVTPLDVYYSTACWLNPHIIASRLDKDILKNIYISCDLSFDIDVSNKVNNLVEAKHQAIAVNDFLAEKGFKIRYSAFSGSKGFHIVCDDPWKDENTEMEPKKREIKAIDERKKLVKEARDNKIIFDEKVTVDTRRIIRLPGTINSKTGLICTPLSRKELESDTETILKLATRGGISTLRISQKREMTAPSANKISGFLGRLGVRPKPKEKINYSTFYTNNIPETKLKIPIIEFEGWMQREKMYLVIEKAQRQYGLGDIHVFSDDEKYWAVSIKALSQRRVEKILQFTSSTNLNQCKKYGCTYTRVGKSIGVNGEVIQSEPILIKTITLKLCGQASRTHLEFFQSLGISINQKNITLCGAGKEKLELIHAIIE
jgi:DNA primase catalytic subunit